MPTSQTTANRCYDGSCPLHCNFHTRKELNTLLFKLLAINQILHFKTYFGDLHSPMLGGLMHRYEAGLAPYFQYEDFFCYFPSDLGSGLSLFGLTLPCLCHCLPPPVSSYPSLCYLPFFVFTKDGHRSFSSFFPLPFSLQNQASCHPAPVSLLGYK